MPRGAHVGRSRRFMWRVSNPQEEEEEDVFNVLLWAEEPRSPVRYIVFQLEVGKEGTPHFQGFLETKREMTTKALLKVFPLRGGHWEFAKKASAACIKYCTKKDTREAGPWEWGKSTSGQGARSDLDRIGDRLLAGETVEALAREFPARYCTFFRGWERLSMFARPPTVTPDLEVWLLEGPTGVGKSRYVYETFSSVFKKPLGGMWFDGYQGEETLLLEEFNGAASHVTLAETLDLLDIYRVQLPIKGAFTWRRCKRVFVCTNTHPNEWYDYASREAQRKALARRFTHVLHWHQGLIVNGAEQRELYVRDSEAFKLYFRLD